MRNDEIHVGIDIGTSSVKCCARNNQRILYEHHKSYGFPCSSIQNPIEIMKTTLEVLEKTQEEISQNIDHLWICGQMHGIVLWNNESMKNDDPTLEPTNINCSSLYNWMFDHSDQSDFLQILPEWPEARIYPGFGLATLAFLHYSKPEMLKPFNCCGTIMDLFICFLLKKSTVSMSLHNAYSWGYCRRDGGSWQDTIRPFLPSNIELPQIIRNNQEVVGDWHDARVHVASGDLQASVASINNSESAHVAYLIIGTSAQLCCLIPVETRVDNLPPTVIRLPYSREHELLAACSMNGGNALQSILNRIGIVAPISELLEELEKTEQTLAETLKICPIFIKERGIEKKLEIRGAENATALEILEATHCGIVRNLFELFPPCLLRSLRVDEIRLVGNNSKSNRFRRHLDCYGFRIRNSEVAMSTPLGATKLE